MLPVLLVIPVLPVPPVPPAAVHQGMAKCQHCVTGAWYKSMLCDDYLHNSCRGLKQKSFS